ncbi:MAG: hypothetical protein ACO3K7_05125, partial [Candidatus Marinamargulisbacteria bacterium]
LSKGPGMVAFCNSGHLTTLTFVFEHRCTEEILRCLSKLFLFSIHLTYPSLFEINGFNLTLNQLPLSHYRHYNTRYYGVFSHSIVLRKLKRDIVVAHSKIPPKEFAVSILNQFKQLTHEIYNNS